MTRERIRVHVDQAEGDAWYFSYMIVLPDDPSPEDREQALEQLYWLLEERYEGARITFYD